MTRHAGIVAAVGLALGLAATSSAQDVEKGKQVYADQKCKLCHAVGGEGNAKGALDKVGAELGAEEIRSWLTDPDAMAGKTGKDRKPKMKKYDKLPPDELDALVAYLLTLKG